MANINEVFGGNALKAEDLKGKSVRVTIESAEIKEFDDGKKVILRFEGKDKCLICNKTNASIIAENLGSSDTDDWIDREIVLTTKKVEFQGKLVPAIRVVLQDTPPPKAKKSEPEPEEDATEAEDTSGVPF